MPTMTIELPSREEQTELNLRRWAEILEDELLTDWPGKVETDRHGYILMSPPAAFQHSRLQGKIIVLLNKLLPGGEGVGDCPVSTADGVRAPDAAWISEARAAAAGNKVCLAEAPEICVEVLSPRNTERAMADKKALFFGAGAREVWYCDRAGKMSFYLNPDDGPAAASQLCPTFPGTITI